VRAEPGGPLRYSHPLKLSHALYWAISPVLLVLGELPLGGRGGKVRLPKEAKLLSVKLREVLEGRVKAAFLFGGSPSL